MKSLDEFKSIITEEKSEYTKFDVLVRAGLANRSQLARIHKVLDKMKEDRPVFTPAEKVILQDVFNKMVDLVSNNKQIFQQTRRAVREENEEIETEQLDESTMYSADYKISPSGRKVHARRFKISDDPTSLDDEEKKKEKEVKEETEIFEAKAPVKGVPPFTLVLKRKAIRQYPGDTRVALYWSDKLKTYFSVPYQEDEGVVTGVVQSESVIETLQKIVESDQSMQVTFTSGDSKKIDQHTAIKITKVYESLNEDNKNKFADMVNKSPEHFSKAADFAFKHVK